jgi:hypothetical protein
MSREPDDYWCLPQSGSHPTLYFHGYRLISRALYVAAVGPDDCDPHVRHGPAERCAGPAPPAAKKAPARRPAAQGTGGNEDE